MHLANIFEVKKNERKSVNAYVFVHKKNIYIWVWVCVWPLPSGAVAEPSLKDTLDARGERLKIFNRIRSL